MRAARLIDANHVAQLGRMGAVPDQEIGRHAHPELAKAILLAKRFGGVTGHPDHGLHRGQAKQGAGHVHRHPQRDNGGRTRVDVGGDRHRHPRLAQGGNRRQLGLFEEVEGGGQQGGDHATVGQRQDPFRIQILQMIHREGAKVGSECAATEIGELIHMPFHRQAVLIRRQIDLLGLGQREADILAEDIYRIGQTRLGGGGIIS